MPDDPIVARRLTVEEFLNYTEKLEYIDGKMMTGPGIELFVDTDQFAETNKEFEAEKRLEEAENEH